MIIQCKCKCGTEFEEYNKWGRKREYIKGHQNRGIIRSDTTKQLMSINHADFKGENNPMYGKPSPRKGLKHSPETKKKMGKKSKGRIHSPETKKKMGEKHKGLKHSPETRQLLSIVKSGEKHPMYGKHHSPETKQLMSEIRKDKYCGENSPNWQGGISRLPYCSIWTPWLKEEIKERDNHQCQNPNCSCEFEKLCVHHIDYDKKNCSTNNLITLCNSCNSKANTNRDHWKEFYSNILMRNN